MMRIVLFFLLAVLLLSGCGVSKSSFSPDKKYSPEQIQKDFSVYQTILEQSHPGLYWYTPKDTMNHYFNSAKEQLKESMTEPQFRKLLNYVTAKIDCGHTSVRSSKKFSRYLDTARSKIFPLSMKLWSGKINPDDDTMVVATNLNRRDSMLTRGTIIKKINDKSAHEIIDTLFNYISTDGYNTTHKYQSL